MHFEYSIRTWQTATPALLISCSISNDTAQYNIMYSIITTAFGNTERCPNGLKCHHKVLVLIPEKEKKKITAQ